MSTPKQAKRKKAKDKLVKYGIKVEPIMIDGVQFNAEKFMLENRFNPKWRETYEWKEYHKETQRRKVEADKRKTEMLDAGLTGVKVKNNNPDTEQEKLDHDAYLKTVRGALATMGACDALKELTIQSVPQVIWNKAKQKKKLTPEQIAEVPLSKILEMTNILMKINDTQIKATSKIVNIEDINKARKEAKIKANNEKISYGVNQFDFENMQNNIQPTDDETGEIVPPEEFKNLLSKVMN